MEKWIQDEIDKLEKEGNKIISVRLWLNNRLDSVDIYKPKPTERQKVCDELSDYLSRFSGISVDLIIEKIKQIRDK